MDIDPTTDCQQPATPKPEVVAPKKPGAMKVTIKTLPLDEIRLDDENQPRERIDEEVVAEYQERMEAGDDFPPVVVFFDDTDHWLADGFHRVHAALKAKFKDIPAQIKQGDKREARWYSFGANKTNGQRRQPGDLSRAVEAILTDKEWAETSQNKIAEHVGCSAARVSQIKASIQDLLDRPQTRNVTRNGSSFKQNISNIGHGSATEKGTESAIGETDTDTGEATRTTTAVKTGKTKVKPGTEKIDPDTCAIMDACQHIQTELDAIAGKRPKQMQTKVLDSLRDVAKRVGELIETIEGGSR